MRLRSLGRALAYVVVAGIAASAQNVTSEEPSSRFLKYIAPGGLWLDTDGNTIHAHAGGIFKEGDLWYWIGQNEGLNLPLNSGFNLYSSPNLVDWTFLGQPISPIPGDPVLDPSLVAERPKLIYSNELQMYVVWWHSDNSTYGLLQQSVALSPNITGPYTYLATYKPLGDNSQDFGLFQDDDGTAYSLYSNGDSVDGRDDKITRLTSNFTAPEETVYTFSKIDLEAPMMVRTPSSYFMIMSHKTGYRPNNVVAYRARSLSGPWGAPFPIAPLGTRTFSSQSTFNIRVDGTHDTTYIYCGDMWASDDLGESRYMWLPAVIDETVGTFKIDWHDLFAVDVRTGLWHPVPASQGTVYEAEDGVVTGGATAQECGHCSGLGIVTGIQGTNSTLTFTNIVGNGGKQWVSFYYINTDDQGFGDNPGGTPDRIGGTFKLSRLASVRVNRGEPVELRQRDSNIGVILSIPLQVTFNEGAGNEMTIGGWNEGVAADLDKIIVYDV